MLVSLVARLALPLKAVITGGLVFIREFLAEDGCVEDLVRLADEDSSLRRLGSSGVALGEGKDTYDGCRLVSLHVFPFLISILACSWLPLPPCLPSFVCRMISILACSWLPLPPLSPFICLVTLHSLSFVSQCWFLCPPPPASPFIAFHLSPNFFGNAIRGLCRVILFDFPIDFTLD